MISEGISKSVVYFKFDFGFFQGFAVLNLSFALPSMALPIIQSYNPDLKKRISATIITVLTTFVVVILTGVFGYLTYGDDCESNILQTFPDGRILIIICRIGILLLVDFVYPLVSQSIMCSWSQLIFHENRHTELPSKKRAVVLICNNAIPVLIAMVLPNSGPALAIGGAFGGCLVDFAIPALLWFMYSKEKWYSPGKLFCLLFAIFGIFSAGISTYLAVADLVTSF